MAESKPESKQRTSKGYEIPLRSREEVLSDFRKIVGAQRPQAREEAGDPSADRPLTSPRDEEEA